MPYPTCHYVMTEGGLCGCPALRGQRYCYHHTRWLSADVVAARVRRRSYELRLDLPPLHDRCSIQDMLNYVFAALCSDTIDYRRAGAMLTALRMASQDLDRPTDW